MHDPYPNIGKFNLSLSFVRGLRIHSEVNSSPLLFWYQAHLGHNCSVSEFKRVVIKDLIVKTLSYLLQSVPTTVPWNKLWKKKREHMKTINS